MFRRFTFLTVLISVVALSVSMAAPAQDHPIEVGLFAGGGGFSVLGSTENSYFKAVATGNCSSGRIDAKVTIYAKRYAAFKITSAGLYNSGGGLVTSTGMQGYQSPIWLGSLYAGGSASFRWWHSAPAGGTKVKFYVSSPGNTTTIGVSAACDT